jgi:hypothetical protein
MKTSELLLVCGPVGRYLLRLTNVGTKYIALFGELLSIMERIKYKVLHYETQTQTSTFLYTYIPPLLGFHPRRS